MTTARATWGSLITEAAFQSVVIELAEVYGWRWYHTGDSRRSPSGFPDLLLLRDGRALAWELKTMRGRLRPDQRAWLAALDAVPGIEAAVRRPSDWEAIEAALKGER